MNITKTTDLLTTQELTNMTTGHSFKLICKMMVKSLFKKLEFKQLKCKHRWTRLSPMLMPKEPPNKLNMKPISATTTQHPNCKVS